MEANEAFREILRREMAKRPELSQNAFAKLIGTNSAYLSEILAGKKDDHHPDGGKPNLTLIHCRPAEEQQKIRYRKAS